MTAPGMRRVNPPELAAPRGFAHAVVATGGQLVLLAGQTALDASGNIVGDDIVTQFRQALGNLLAALRAAGGDPTRLARMTVYAVDVAYYRAHTAELGAVWRELVGADYPAMALIGVTRLWDERALVEVDGIAVLP
jgi:enamine deaminase RidA (YjgF/YER057c/UK114 family)